MFKSQANPSKPVTLTHRSDDPTAGSDWSEGSVTRRQTGGTNMAEPTPPLGLIDAYAVPGDDPDADLAEWEGVTTTSDPNCPQFDVTDDEE